jgi:hypothetical protein
MIEAALMGVYQAIFEWKSRNAIYAASVCVGRAAAPEKQIGVIRVLRCG